MLDSVSRDAPTEEFAMAVYYLIKQVGLSHSDIFGRRTYTTREIDTGSGTTQVRDVVREPAMNAKTFQTYLDLMEKDAEQQEKERKKQKMKQSLKGGATMG